MITNNDLLSEEKFNEFYSVQMSGSYNMLDPRARDLTDLSKDEWLRIINNYSAHSKAYL